MTAQKDLPEAFLLVMITFSMSATGQHLNLMPCQGV